MLSFHHFFHRQPVPKNAESGRPCHHLQLFQQLHKFQQRFIVVLWFGEKNSLRAKRFKLITKGQTQWQKFVFQRQVLKIRPEHLLIIQHIFGIFSVSLIGKQGGCSGNP